MTPGQIAAVIAHLDNQKEQLDRIEEQVKETNGRVRSLEMWKARAEGIILTWRWIGPVIASVLTAVLLKAANLV